MGSLYVVGVIALLAIIIKVDSPGPALFRQDRVTLGGRHFRFYKFRTMYVDAEARQAELHAANEMQGAMFKLRDDPRVTPLGKWLRARHLDEPGCALRAAVADGAVSEARYAGYLHIIEDPG